ncbi:hypothetical protein F4815DRAFT_443167 [Daldinia loculata]|nr:hypothetical protein F4815DRAFT_443167 [Daldinia loculata]
MPSIPLLWEFLPKEGFRWKTYGGTWLLTSSQTRAVVRGMRSAGRRLDEQVVTEYVAEFFDTATDLVHKCEKWAPVVFWGQVGSRVSWSRNTFNGTLHDFSTKVISARRLFHDSVDFYVEMGYKDLPESSHVRDFNEANLAVDRFTRAIIDTYGADSKVREKYYPKWMDDSDNEGTAEATKARFREKCEAPRNLSTEATAKDQSNGLEGEYEEMVEMVENVEIVDRMDEGVDGEMDKMDFEMDYEMEMDN